MKKLTIAALAMATAGTFGAVAIAQDADRPERGERPPGDRGGRPDAQAMFAEMDADRDGKVSKTEYVAFVTKQAEGRFARMDEDGDGFVAPEDMRRSGGPRGPREGGDARPHGGGKPKPGGAE